MSIWESRTIQRIRHEYVMPNPVNWVEVGKAFAAAKVDYEDAMGRSADDSIWVTHADDEVIVYWEEKTR